ncbi:MAG: tRNA pseudouridine32 synthase/23S rRNA pseudouridine746 synthase [Saprospiraceae bacterium]|jgi:tRNA pseudouridine32 synthase/23S rRNA pseudouridine746 synthase
MNPTSCFTYFNGSIEDIALPEMFTFPFYYDPHPLALLATAELQGRIQNDIKWEHGFGLGENVSDKSVGKMFGVLVVKNSQGEIGYLAAFSGKLEEQNLDSIFVPSIYNRSIEQDHYCIEEEKLNQLSKQINKLEADPNLAAAKEILENKKIKYGVLLLAEKSVAQKESKIRKLERKQIKLVLEENAYHALHENHVQKSINDKFFYNAYAEYLGNKLANFQSEYDLLNDKITDMKDQRKSKSNGLQDMLFAQYNFLNGKGESKNVVDLFKGRIPNIPPSGAGDCAAPKLLQYAYQNGYEPIALAEFWWGKEPKSKVRKHQYFYPACRGKCEPILNFMLEGINVVPNPLLTNPAFGKKLETVYEDDHLVVIHKPAEFLSVPGKYISDSVQERMLKKYPNATGPMIVHRLDMSTSGLMVVAKSKIVHKALQQEFKRKRVTKRYVALLDGVLEKENGHIDLPLRLDLDNRPFQLVCYEHGKPCRTRWEVIERYATTTKVYFYPLSGRTHQLRVHAAHHDGLGTPIVGDDLYGIKKDHLHLHAELIAFKHPITEQLVEVEVAAKF